MPSEYDIFHSSSTLETSIDISTDKKLGQMKWNVMMEKLLLWNSACMTSAYAQIYTEGGASYG